MLLRSTAGDTLLAVVGPTADEPTTVVLMDPDAGLVDPASWNTLFQCRRFRFTVDAGQPSAVDTSGDSRDLSAHATHVFRVHTWETPPSWTSIPFQFTHGAWVVHIDSIGLRLNADGSYHAPTHYREGGNAPERLVDAGRYVASGPLFVLDPTDAEATFGIQHPSGRIELFGQRIPYHRVNLRLTGCADC
jgi:hypothetical protein